jgi:hypothetical protein
MPGATLPSSDTLAVWTDNTDNWRAEDADYLQRRSILRFSTTGLKITALGPSLSIPSPTAGQAAYVTQTDSIEYIDSTGAWRQVNAFKHADFDDSAAGFGMRISTDSSNAITLETGQAVLGANRNLIVTGSSVLLKTGAATATLTTNSTHLLSSLPLSASAASLGAITATSVDAGAGLVESGSLHVTGQATVGTLAGGASSLGAVTATSVNTGSGAITGGALTGTTVRGGVAVLGTGTNASRLSLFGSTTAYVDLYNSATTVAGDSITLAPTSDTTAVMHSVGLPFATVLVSSGTPVAADYPEGTLWVKP